LAQWVSLALRKALLATNIKKGFTATGIFPVNARAVDAQMLPSQVFESQTGEQHSANAHGDTVMHTEFQDDHGNDEDIAGHGDTVMHTELQDIRGADDYIAGHGDTVENTGIQCNQEEDCDQRDGGRETDNAPGRGEHNLEDDFAQVPQSSAEHFFVDVDPLNPSADEELVGLDATGEDVGSITRFLTLPTAAAHSSARM
jgi:hypothetical protein